MNSIHKELPANWEVKAIRQGVIVPIDEMESEWLPSLERHERQFNPSPEQPQWVWERVLGFGRDATRERMFA
jgi:hypothetical protein